MSLTSGYRIAILVAAPSGSELEGRIKADTRSLIDSLYDRHIASRLYNVNELVQQGLEDGELNESVVLTRVNPGELSITETQYIQYLQLLENNGKYVIESTENLLKLGSKEVLTRISATKFYCEDLHLYRSIDELAQGLECTLERQTRVLKINRGSLGRGVWRIQRVSKKHCSDFFVRVTEAATNKEQVTSFSAFLEEVGGYLNCAQQSLIDMPYLSEINDGEIRVVLVGTEPAISMLKVPANNDVAFGAGITSGASYFFDENETLARVRMEIGGSVPAILEASGVTSSPLLWAIDIIPLADEKLVISEINCSCVGFYYALDAGVQNKVVRLMETRLARHNIAMQPTNIPLRSIYRG